MTFSLKNQTSLQEIIDPFNELRLFYNPRTQEWSYEENGDGSHFFLLVLEKLGINSRFKKVNNSKKQRTEFINAASTYLFSSLYGILKDDPDNDEIAEMILSLDNDFSGRLDDFVGDHTMEWFDLTWEVISNVLTGMLDLNMEDYLTGEPFQGYDHDWLQIAVDIKQHHIFNKK